MKLLQFYIFILTVLVSQVIHCSNYPEGLDFSWLGKDSYGQYRLAFDKDTWLKRKTTDSEISLFDKLPNDIAFNIFNSVGTSDKYALREVTKNLSKRIIIFFDGREAQGLGSVVDGTTQGPMMYLKTKKTSDWVYYMYMVLNPAYEYASIPPSLVDYRTDTLCTAMAEGRLQYGGHLCIMNMADYELEGFGILADSLKHQKHIDVIFHGDRTWTPLVHIIQLLEALATDSCVKDLRLCSIGLTDNALPVLTKFLSRTSTLESLNITLNSITDEGAGVLAKTIKNNTSLKTINLTASMNLSAQGLQKLHKAFHHGNVVEYKKDVAPYTNDKRICIRDQKTNRKLYISETYPEKARVIMRVIEGGLIMPIHME